MKDKKSKSNGGKRSTISKIVPYAVFFVAIFATMLAGSSKDYQTTQTSLIMSVINDDGFVVTADQLSESYIVAELANALELPSAASVSADYISVALKYTLAGSVDSGIIEKPTIIDTSNLSRGIKTYIVADGDTLPTIATRHGVTATQIRWSNNMKTEALSVGQRLFIPTIPGIVYTVKSGEDLAGIAEKYKSDAKQIVTYNDLETSALVAGMTIILPGGELPEKERPEYVAPVARPITYSTSPARDSGTRHDMRIVSRGEWYVGDYPGNPNYSGQCTWFAWYWRAKYAAATGQANYAFAYGEVIGNARDWVARLRSRYATNNSPAIGAVVQTTTSGWGHVGVVVNMVPGSHIIVQEMNYEGRRNVVVESRINWSDATRYVYIHGRY